LTDPSLIAAELTQLGRGQLFAVVATQGGDKPYASLVAFAITDDLKLVVFATKRGTKKYANMMANPEVALLLDDRSNDPRDLTTGIAVTATGKVSEAPTDERDRLLKLFTTKHPSLAGFVAAEDTALMKVHVDSYVVVTRFQQVITLYVTSGGLSENPEVEA
jgi:heme iron utilization protein